MSQRERERNAYMVRMRKAGKTYKEIGDKYRISATRALQIIRNEMRLQERERHPEKKKELEEEYKRIREMRKGREYIIRNGGADLFLTAIEEVHGHPCIYRYGSKNPKEAMRFTKEEADEIARKRKAVVCCLAR